MMWLEDKTAENRVSTDARYDIMHLARNPNLTGKDIWRMLVKNGHEISYKQVMSVATPIFSQRKLNTRLEKLGRAPNLPTNQGITGQSFKPIYVKQQYQPEDEPTYLASYRDNPHFDPIEMPKQPTWDMSTPRLQKADTRRILKKPFEI